jgi:hypothetical protein
LTLVHLVLPVLTCWDAEAANIVLEVDAAPGGGIGEKVDGALRRARVGMVENSEFVTTFNILGIFRQEAVRLPLGARR